MTRHPAMQKRTQIKSTIPTSFGGHHASALTHYEPYQEGEHDQPPARRHRTVNNPVTGMLRQLTGRPQNPRYWYVQEFDV